MSTKAVTSKVHTSAVTSPKGKSLFHPSCVFETGSTLATDPCILTTINISNRGNRSNKGCHINVNESQSEYLPLKVVPNCKFCGAKRFQISSGQFKKILRCIREGCDSSAALKCGDDTIGSKSYSIQFKCQERRVNSTR